MSFYLELIVQSLASFIGAYIGARYLPPLIESSMEYIKGK